jgi:predicted 2-oxoglutarate/Fe(II)-dependent dioxygenase YbiX
MRHGTFVVDDMFTTVTNTLPTPKLIKYPGEPLTVHKATPLRKPTGTYMRLSPGTWMRRKVGNKGEIWKTVRKLPKEIHVELMLMNEPAEPHLA